MQQQNTLITPKVIHFIWAGGDKPFPNHDVLQAWQKANPDFQIILWIDKTTTNKKIIEQYETEYKYKQLSTTTQLQESIYDTNPPLKRSIFIADIEEMQVSHPRIRYELDRLDPNYGLSSDLLRYNILYEYGGVYLDSDILPGEKPLNKEGYDFYSEKQGLKGSFYTQGLEAIGNDFFICPPKSSVMKQVFNYCLKRSINNPENLLHFNFYKVKFENDSSRFPPYATWTVTSTGPDAVKRFFDGDMTAEGWFDTNGEDSRTAYGLSPTTYSPKSENDQNWLKSKVKVSEDIPTAIRLAVSAANYEAKEMKMLRVSDHVNDICLSLLRPLELSLETKSKELKKTDELTVLFNGKEMPASKDSIKVLKKLLQKFVAEQLLDEKSIQPLLTKLNSDNPEAVKSAFQALVNLISPTPPWRGEELYKRVTREAAFFKKRQASCSGMLFEAYQNTQVKEECMEAMPFEKAIATKLLDQLPKHTLEAPNVFSQERNHKYQNEINHAIQEKTFSFSKYVGSLFKWAAQKYTRKADDPDTPSPGKK